MPPAEATTLCALAAQVKEVLALAATRGAYSEAITKGLSICSAGPRNPEKEMTAAQARFLTQSSNSKQIFAEHTSEYIQFDDPDTVISAIREVYDQTKRP